MNINELSIGHIGQRIQVVDDHSGLRVAGTLFAVGAEYSKIYASRIDREYEEPLVGRRYVKVDIGFQEGVSLSQEATFTLEGDN